MPTMKAAKVTPKLTDGEQGLLLEMHEGYHLEAFLARLDASFWSRSFTTSAFAEQMITELNSQVGSEEVLTELYTESPQVLLAAVEPVRRVPRGYVRAKAWLFLVHRRAACNRLHDLDVLDFLLADSVRIICQDDEVG